MRRILSICKHAAAIAILLLAVPLLNGQDLSPWDGDWITDFGPMSIAIEDGKIFGSLGKGGEVSGSTEGSSAQLTYKSKPQSNGRSKYDGTTTLQINTQGNQFHSTKKNVTLRGWKISEDFADKETADFSGHWLSNQGNVVLEQDGDKVTGIYGSQGLATISGTVVGNRLEFNWKKLHWTGKGFIEQNEDGSRIYGTTIESESPFIWMGCKAAEYVHHAQPKAGEIVKGYADNGMLYHLRMPDGWEEGDPVDVVTLFHGSNFTTLGMVFITAKNWPDIGKKFAILGIQGERWAKWSDADDLRHNYSYVNWMGRSTYKGYPYTDRESPNLVMEVLQELGDEHDFERVFVGGHSQGGYLSYVLHMHFADKIDGAFPVAGGMIIQAEPDVFEDEALMKAQRTTPIAIVHGKNDNVVDASMGEYAYNRLLSHDFHNVKFINPSSGHPYDFLPIDEAINYLDALTTDDTKVLLKYTQSALAKKDWRTVGLAVARAKELGAGKEFATTWKTYNEAAKKQVDRYVKEIGKGEYGKWVDRFLRWREDFALADGGKPANEAWEELVELHSAKAKELATESRNLFRENKADEGWAIRKDIVLNFYASPQYRTYRDGVEKKFGKLSKLAQAKGR